MNPDMRRNASPSEFATQSGLVRLCQYGADQIDGGLHEGSRGMSPLSKNCLAQTLKGTLLKRLARIWRKRSRWFWMQTATCPSSHWRARTSFGKL